MKEEVNGLTVYFAPLEGITSYTYRNLHHKFYGGVDRYFTPFLSPGPEQGLSVREARDVLPERNGGLDVVPQILTNRGEDFVKAAQALAAFGYREVNLNLGCPSGTVTAKRKGSGMLQFTDELVRMLDIIFESEPVRHGEMSVSIKTRIGRNAVEEWPALLEIYNQYPITELTIHPRIQKEFYKGAPHMDKFRLAVEKSKNPLVYNGDLTTVEDVRQFSREFPNIRTIMIGRGLVRNPGFAEQIRSASWCGRTDAAGCGPFDYDREKLRNFHDELLQAYEELMSGDRNVLFRMKEIWAHLAGLFPDNEKEIKKIQKATRVVEYKAAAREILG